MDDEKKVQKFKKIWFIWNLVEAVIILAAGVLAIVFGVMRETGSTQNDSPIQITVAAAIGAFVILDGLLRILTVLLSIKKTEQSVMLIGGFEITGGIVVILFRDMFVQLIVTFLYVFLIVIGVLMLIFSIYAIAKKIGKLYMPVLEIIFGALLLALGIAVCIMYYNGDSSNKIVLIVIGVIMAAFGITQGIIAVVSYKKKTVVENDIAEDATSNVPAAREEKKMKKKGKKEKEKEPEEVIDVEAKDVEEPKQIKGDSPKEIKQKNDDKSEAAE